MVTQDISVQVKEDYVTGRGVPPQYTCPMALPYVQRPLPRHCDRFLSVVIANCCSYCGSKGGSKQGSRHSSGLFAMLKDRQRRESSQGIRFTMKGVWPTAKAIFMVGSSFASIFNSQNYSTVLHENLWEIISYSAITKSLR